MGRHSRRGRTEPAGDPEDPVPVPTDDGATGPGGGWHSRGTGPGSAGPYGDAPPTPPGGTPGYGTPYAATGAPGERPGPPRPAAARVRGGHPEQREPGGGWGTAPQPAPRGGPARPAPYGTGVARPLRQPGGQVPRPRQEYVEAFDEGVFPAGAPAPEGSGFAGRDTGIYIGREEGGSGRARGSSAAPGTGPGTGSPAAPGIGAGSRPAADAGGHAGARPRPVTREGSGARDLGPGARGVGPDTGATARIGPDVRPNTRPEPGPDRVPGGEPGRPAGDRAPAARSGAEHGGFTAGHGGGPPEATSGEDGGAGGGNDGAGGAVERRVRGGKGRAFTGVAAAAVTTVLAIVVAGQVADGGSGGTPVVGDGQRDDSQDASRSDQRPEPAESPAAVPLSYADKLAQENPLDPELAGSGEFETVGGTGKGSGKGQVLRYRVDVEKGLPLDAEFFAQAVQKTLNDKRSWSHDGAYSFERVSEGRSDFAITLASPGTTATWCAKSGLDTTVDNVSCDSAATDRVMINAYRWARGSKTFEDKISEYREMLINHEVGHRLGLNHERCGAEGARAPVMMQQTKSLTSRGLTCRTNAWPFP